MYRKKLIVSFIVFIIFLIAAYGIFSFVFKVDVLGIILTSPEAILVFIISIISSELVRALRLSILYRENIRYQRGLLPLYMRSVAARFSSNVVSVITPSALGGEFVRGLIVSGLKKEMLPTAIGVGLADGLYDLFTNVILAIILLPVLGSVVVGLTIILLGLASSTAWVLALLIVSGRIRSRILAKLPLINHPALKQGGRAVVNSFNKKVLFQAMLLSVVGWLLIALGYHLATTRSCPGIRLSIVRTLTYIIYAFLLGIIPTPAGLVTMDTWLASTICPSTAVLWRTSGLITVFIMASLSIPHIVTIIREYKTMLKTT